MVLFWITFSNKALEVSLCRKCLEHPDREQFENVHGEYLFPSWVLNEMLEEDSRCLCVPEDADGHPTPQHVIFAL